MLISEYEDVCDDKPLANQYSTLVVNSADDNEVVHSSKRAKLWDFADFYSTSTSTVEDYLSEGLMAKGANPFDY